MVPLPARIDSRGDKLVAFRDERSWTRERLLAHMVLEAHRGLCPPDHTVHFKDGNRLNCAIENLDWVPATRRPVGVPGEFRKGKLQDIRVDAQGRIFDEEGARLVINGLEPEKVLESLAEVEAGRTIPWEDVMAKGRRLDRE